VYKELHTIFLSLYDIFIWQYEKINVVLANQLYKRKTWLK
jgi:hypothetical protein